MQQAKYKQNKRAGFSLVETLVAVAVLSVALTPVFAQVTAAFRLSRIIKENLISTMLAQEGVELVRGIRDGNWFRDDPFDTGLADCDDCYMQYDDLSLNSGTVPKLQLDARGRYQYGSGPDTLYTRTITVETISTVQLKVTSEVTWDSRGTDRSVVVESYLFDWLNP